VWANVNIKLLDKKSGSVQTHILENVWGKAEAGKTTAIMGANGAGKTSLFQTLTGRVTSSAKLVVESQHIYLGGILWTARFKSALPTCRNMMPCTNRRRRASLSKLRMPKTAHAQNNDR
jgi:ABC-type cobalamin/Fe3+-siderophores transport system ATPase subunit